MRILIGLALACTPPDDPSGPPDRTERRCESMEGVFDLPFDYRVGSDRVWLRTDGGELPLLLGPWGAHAPPHTGHPEGNAKSDLQAVYADSYDDVRLVRLTSDIPQPGACRPGERCGVALDAITERIPTYRAPDPGPDAGPFTVERVALVDAGGAHDLDRMQWEVFAVACPFSYHFGHVGRIGADLRDAMLEAGYADPDLETVPGDDLITGEPVVLDPGDAVAIPQIRYSPIDSHPGYASGWGGIGAVPWAQIEYTAIDQRIYGKSRSEYSLLPAARRGELLEAMLAEGRDPESFRYAQPWAPPWLWRAEMVLEASPPFAYDATGDLFSRMGGWWERAETPCDPWQDERCDDLFSIFDIHSASELHDPALYGPDVTHLVFHNRAGDGRFGEVSSPSDPHPTEGSLTLRWRVVHAGQQELVQAMSYRYDPAADRLVVRWGPAMPAGSKVEAPPRPSDVADCNGDSVVCYGHEGYWGGSGGG